MPSKMLFADFKAAFIAKYGTQWPDSFIIECYNVYDESEHLDDTLEWVRPMMIDTDF